MIKKLALIAAALLIPTLACAGLVNIYVVTGSSSGKIADGLKSGYKTAAVLANLSSATGYELKKVVINGVTKTTAATSGHLNEVALSIPLSGTTQTVSAYFGPTAAASAQAVVLVASCPTVVNVTPGTGTTFAGQTSTVKYAPGAMFTFSGPAGFHFTNVGASAIDPNNIKTVITADAGTASGQGTLTLTSGLVTASTNFQITVVGTGVAASNACLACHAVWSEANTYAGSAHAQNAVACQNCHSTSHPDVTVTSANSCENCHSAPTTNFLRSVHWTNQMNNFTDFATANAYLLAVEGPNGADVPPNGQWTQDCTNSCHFNPKNVVGKDACNACHNPHRPETGLPTDPTAANVIFFDYGIPPGPGTATGVAGTQGSLVFGYWKHDTGCVNCHHQGNGEGNAPYLYDDNDFPTTPHFDTTATYGSPGTGVAFMNAGQTCANCHGHYNDINTQYGQSGHANVASPAWAEGGSNSSCVRCHTTQGFINYSSFHVSTAITDTKSVLGCNGCHTNTDMTYSPFGNLTSVNGKVGTIRKIAAFPAPYKNGSNSSFTFPDAGPSNVCIPCHAGRKGGQAVKALNGSLNNASFANPHYATAAGILYQSIGYEFTGASYAKPVYFAHDQIGINHFAETGHSETGVVGPCATCHYLDGPGHTLHIFTKDQTGAVTAVNSTLCVVCHSTYPMDVAAANSNITGFQAALGALQAQLQSQGVYYYPNGVPNAPGGTYFADASNNPITDWTAVGVTGTDGTNNMGAAFNLQLLTKEPGAYAHNRLYTKRLIFDSLDWLQNASISGHIAVSGDAATYLGTTTRP
jgi:hypothetical protein